MKKSNGEVYVMVIAMLAFFLLSSCSISVQNKSQIPDVQSGFEGLTLSFPKNIPPPFVFERSTFPVIVRAKNAGTYDIGEGSSDKALLNVVVEKDYHSKIELDKSSVIKGALGVAQFSLEGKTSLNPKGMEEVISYSVQTKEIDPQSERHESTLYATVCYPYQTMLATSACIDTDPYELRPIKKSCATQSLQFANGQGAPVAITAIEPIMLVSPDQKSVRPQFLITIENKGNGEVLKRSSYGRVCEQKEGDILSYTDFNVVTIKAELSGKALECDLLDGEQSEEVEVRLRDKVDVVRCVALEGDAVGSDKEAYTAPLVIQLDYGYMHSIAAQYIIRKPVTR